MTTTVEAVYEGGLLRPARPIALPEGTRVQVTVTTEDRPAEPVRDMLARIAALPREGATEEFSGADHDKVLYGSRGAR